MFDSFFLAGFECSSHRRHDGQRLDLLAASGHDQFVDSDYRSLLEVGIKSARDGLRWHLIETSPGHYDWSSFLPMLRAARDNKVQVVWDLCHYGWPDDIDIWSPAFVDRFARFAAAAARVVREETGAPPFFCPVNEISFWAWAGGDLAHMNPGTHGRGGELKWQLVRATIAAINAVRQEHREARFLCAEPAINVDGGLGSPEHRAHAAMYTEAQYEACDMISGRSASELGGTAEHLDVVGVNFYPHNQWYHNGNTIPLGHHAFKPFSRMLAETYERYGRPIAVSETGAEGSARAAWVHYVLGEVLEAIDQGVEIAGVCLYPILDIPGWTDERACPVGLFSAPKEDGSREVYRPLLREIAAYQRTLASRARGRSVTALPTADRTLRRSRARRGAV